MKISHLIENKSLISKLIPYNFSKFQTINPQNNWKEESFGYHERSEISKRIENSHKSFNNWKNYSLEKRLEKMNNLANTLELNKEMIAKVITTEMGKPITESITEINKSIKYIKFYQNQDYIKSCLKDKKVIFDNYDSTVHYQPVGPILSINPWNFPIFVPFKSIIPSMIAGNTIILKPASCVPKTSLLLEKFFIESGFDNNEFQVVFADNETTTNQIISDDRIRYVIFTGSTTAGSCVGALAGKYLKKSLLELGGSDPCIVFDDCDIDLAVKFSAEGRLRNSGQACICLKRIIIMENVFDEFMGKLFEEVKKYKVGNPYEKDTKIGPLARFDLFLKLKEQTLRSIKDGAKLMNSSIEEIDCDFTIGNGNYFNPVFLTDIPKNSTTYKEEFFGPVFNIFKVKTREEAINLANDTQFGLGASIFSKDVKSAEEFAKNIDCGMVFINASTFSDPNIPYGGMKNSGYGRTSAWEAFREYTNPKVVTTKIK